MFAGQKTVVNISKIVARANEKYQPVTFILGRLLNAIKFKVYQKVLIVAILIRNCTQRRNSNITDGNYCQKIIFNVP